jgi:hypothetical protein
MKKEGKLLKVLLVVLTTAVLIHTIAQFTFFSPGISGLLIGNEKVGEEFSPKGSFGSMIFLVVEWFVLISLFTFTYTRYRRFLDTEYEELKIIKERKHSNRNTALDDLYEFLKEKKEIRVSTIAKTFNVNKRLVEEWAKTLESNNFATLVYPQFGGPKLVLKE